jgi:diguanylate cyclase (GGDEF)-like protein/PAS domain S-box-containing protein
MDMQSAALPPNESQRLAVLKGLDILDSCAESEFDALVRTASLVCGMPISLISLIDEDRQWFKANVGLPGVSETPRAVAFCSHAILNDGLFEVCDATQDSRFADNPLVAGPPDIRFYAGAPVRMRDGSRIGTLCVIDRQPGCLSATQRDILLCLADAVAAALEGRRARKMEEAAVAALRKSEYFLDRTGKLAGVGGWEIDLASGAIFWSDETCRIHGLTPGHQPGMDEALGYYTAEARPVIEAAVAACMAGGDGWDLELQLVRADGRAIWMRSVGTVEFIDGKPVGVTGACQDVSERVAERLALEAARERSVRDMVEARRLGATLAEQHELLRVTLESIGDAVITTDATGRIVWLNPVAERLTGWASDAARTLPLDQVFYLLQDGNSPKVLLSRQGAEYGIEDSASPIRNAQGETIGAVLVFHDVTEQRRLSGEMRHRATHDALTGLTNRAEFENRLRRLLQTAQGDNSRHALLFIDLDQFKLVNDACGHPAGDVLLQQVSRLLAETVRARDTLARLGGDEFAIILENCAAEQAQRVAQQICDRMEDFRFIHDERRFRIGASIGLVPLDARWSTTEAVMQAADTSCYAAKEAGRNRVHAWFDTDEAMRHRHGEMQWTSRIEQALDDDGFALYAQRIGALNDDLAGTGIHAEVLLRMRDGDGALVLPGAFLPAAERFHLATRIDRWVMKKAIAWMQQLPGVERIDMLAVNLSGQSVGDRAFHRWAIDLLRGAGPAVCQRLCLEITETAAVTNLADAAQFIEQLRAVGVRMALDDFGAGASSFGYLKSLPVDYLKIDGQFVRDLISDPLDEAAVRCFADVARVVGMRTIAEFVEHPAVLQRLREIGIDFAQGYLLHRPAPIDELIDGPAAAVDDPLEQACGVAIFA